MELTGPAKMIMYIFVVQALFYELFVLLMPITLAAKLLAFILVLIIFGISGFLWTYSINCMGVGGCTVWPWVLAASFAVGLVFSILGSFIRVLTLPAPQVIQSNNK
jgi:hypothetical protein